MPSTTYKRIAEVMFSFEDNVGFLTGGCNLERLVWFFMGYIYAVSKAEGKPVDDL